MPELADRPQDCGADHSRGVIGKGGLLDECTVDLPGRTARYGKPDQGCAPCGAADVRPIIGRTLAGRNGASASEARACAGCGPAASDPFAPGRRLALGVQTGSV